jgi:predicted ATPase/DNA-binding CsgD family transcriptional regulator
MVDSQTRSGNLLEPLTEREREILACLVSGLSNGEIAHRMHLAVRTVKWYNSQIYGKLGVSSRGEAVAQAHLLGLLDAPDHGQAVAQPRHNLPIQTTPFIGRQQEVSDLTRLMAEPETRLITILAPGGMGKTRLAQIVAEHQLCFFADGVFFVSLAPLSAASAIVTTIAESIGFSFYGDNPPSQQLIDFLQDRWLLLVLDNFEHVLNGASLVADILKAAPKVRILATSRERLNLHGETVYSLRGLAFPAREAPQDALDYDAAKLFVHSAQRARADFALQPDDLDALTRICRLTEGMPLGIELAAGWVDVLSLERIAAEIQHGLDILETDLRDVPDRQRSVRATFERTWERLTDDERATFAKLSVFRGGFTLPAAQTVAGANARTLRGLAQKALIQLEDGERFAVHELLRQFGAGKLAEAGELLSIQARHADFFAEFLAERKQDIKTNRQLEALERIGQDFDNIRTAWLYLVRHQCWEMLPSFLFSLWFYCDVRARGQEASDLLERAAHALQSAPASTMTELTLGRVLAPLGWFYSYAGLATKGAATCDEAIRILRQHDSPEDLIIALFDRQHAAFNLFQPDVAVHTAEEGLRIAQSIGDKYWEGHLLPWAGAGPQTGIEVSLGQTHQFAERALALFEKMEDFWGIKRATFTLGSVHEVQKEYEQAKRCFGQALSIAELFDHSFSITNLNVKLASLARAEGDYATAHVRSRQALRASWDAGYTWLAPYPLYCIASVYADQRDVDRAVAILATIQPHPLAYGHIDRNVQALREELEATLEPERFRAAWARGQGRAIGALVAELLAEPVGSDKSCVNNKAES